jgi:hypothetical protein
MNNPIKSGSFELHKILTCGLQILHEDEGSGKSILIGKSCFIAFKLDSTGKINVLVCKFLYRLWTGTYLRVYGANNSYTYKIWMSHSLHSWILFSRNSTNKFPNDLLALSEHSTGTIVQYTKNFLACEANLKICLNFALLLILFHHSPDCFVMERKNLSTVQFGVLSPFVEVLVYVSVTAPQNLTHKY